MEINTLSVSYFKLSILVLFNPFKIFQAEIKGLSNVEKVLLETADGVMETKRKLEFGVQQIIFKVTKIIFKVIKCIFKVINIFYS